MSDQPPFAPPIIAPLGDRVTPRLRLRRLRGLRRLDALSVVFAKPEVWRFPYGRGFTREETAEFLATQIAEWHRRTAFGCWLAIEKASNRVIGYVGISVPHFLPEILPAVEVGWRFDPDVWGARLCDGRRDGGAGRGFRHSRPAGGVLGATEREPAIEPGLRENQPSG